MITKQGASLWSGHPVEQGFRYNDVTEAAAAATPEVGCRGGVAGDGTVVSATVVHDSGDARSVAVIEVGGERTIASCTDAAVIESFERDECCGRAVAVSEDGTFALT